MPPSSQPTQSPFALHVARWANGCGSEDCAHANKIVHARGTLPCDVAFVGEAPGVSEDTIGQPFVGPAGDVMDTVVRRSLAGLCVCPHEDCTAKPFRSMHRPGDQVTVCPECGRQQSPHPVTYAMFNLVGCIPKDGDGEKRTPSVECIVQCAPRLQELLDMARPRLVVCVGKMPADWLKQGYKNPVQLPRHVKLCNILHPAYILRQNVAQKEFMVQRSVVAVATAVEGL